MRDSYAPLFQDVLTSSIWAHPDKEVRIAWFFFMAKADEEGFVSGSVPGLAGQAHISVEGMRRAIAEFEAPDADSRNPEHEGRRLQRVERGWRVLGTVAMRERAAAEAERARKRRWAQQHRAGSTGSNERNQTGDYAPPEAPSNEPAKQEALPECDPRDRQGPRVDAVSTLRSEPVDARKRKEEISPREIDSIERQLGVPPPPPSHLNKREGVEEVRFFDLDGFEPSEAFVAYAERYGLPPMALHERLRKVRNAKVAIGGKNGVGDREQWCRDQLPRWKKWWLDDGGRAEPLPVTRRPPARPEPASSPAAMPEVLRKFVATGELPPKTVPPPAAEVAA